VPSDEGMWPQIRSGLSYSFWILSRSLFLVLIGVCVVLPWALLLLLAYKLIRRWWAKPRPASTSA